MLWLKLFLPFAGAYFLSYLYRTANAVIGPVLTDELALGAGSLGLLTSAYFLAFAAAQLPLGMLLDRFGARRVESSLLLIAAAGALVFALGHSIADLAIGRGLIGFGVSACLMAAFKAFSLWFPADRQASLTGWIMTSGGLGALAATAPLEAALQVTGWRDIFFGLAALTLAVSFWLFFSVPEKQSAAQPQSLRAQWDGVKEVFASAHFWRFAPLGLTITGGFMAIQSLWSISWLMQVNGHSRRIAADHLAGMSAAMLVTYVLIGLLATWLARRGVKPVMLLAGALAISLVVLALIVTQASAASQLLWIAYGIFSSFGTLAYSQAAGGFPLALSGRANTGLQPPRLHRCIRHAMGHRPAHRLPADAGAIGGQRPSQFLPGAARPADCRLPVVLHCGFPGTPHTGVTPRRSGAYLSDGQIDLLQTAGTPIFAQINAAAAHLPAQAVFVVLE